MIEITCSECDVKEEVDTGMTKFEIELSDCGCQHRIRCNNCGSFREFFL
jgi:uncharacterized Zn finger protein